MDDRGVRRIPRSAMRLRGSAAAAGHAGKKLSQWGATPPSTGSGSGNRASIRPMRARPDRARVLVGRAQQAEVQLGDRDGADRRLDAGRQWVAADQDRRIEDRAHPLLRPGIAKISPERLEIALEGGIDRQLPEIGQAGGVDPLPSSSRAQLGHGTTGNGDRELLSRFRAPQDLPNLVAKVFLRDRRHGRTVAVLLPGPRPGRTGPPPPWGEDGTRERRRRPRRSARRCRRGRFWSSAWLVPG